jgi:hypothetical protein
VTTSAEVQICSSYQEPYKTYSNGKHIPHPGLHTQTQTEYSNDYNALLCT